MPHVFFYEAFAEETELLRQFMPSNIDAEYTDLTIQESGHVVPPARIISTRTQSLLPLAWAPQLDAILSRSTGFDHLAAYAAAISGKLDAPVQFGYLPLYCHRAVAEQAMLLWMALLRRLPRQIRQFYDFHRDGLTGFECQGRTLVVVGVGNIGHEICDIGRALRMNVLGVDRDPRHVDVTYATIDAALAVADIVVCAMDLNPTSRGYFDAARWRQVKPGALFINISRGELSPSTALVAALDAGQLGGVGIDVYDHEAELAVALRGVADGPIAHDAKPAAPSGATGILPVPGATGVSPVMGATGVSPVRSGDSLGTSALAARQWHTSTADPEALAALELARRDNCICTPHNAFNSYEGVERKSLHSVQQLVALLETGQFLWPARLV